MGEGPPEMRITLSFLNLVLRQWMCSICENSPSCPLTIRVLSCVCYILVKTRIFVDRVVTRYYGEDKIWRGTGSWVVRGRQGHVAIVKRGSC